VIPINYDLAKVRMADRLREAERHRLVQQAKASAREERDALRTPINTPGRLSRWAQLRGRAAQVQSTSVSRPTL
jgi:hypothetical protein